MFMDDITEAGRWHNHQKTHWTFAQSRICTISRNEEQCRIYHIILSYFNVGTSWIKWSLIASFKNLKEQLVQFMYGSCMVHVQFMYSSFTVIGTVQFVCCAIETTILAHAKYVPVSLCGMEEMRSPTVILSIIFRGTYVKVQEIDQ